MDERAGVPVMLPRDRPTRPFWQTPPDPELADYRSTEELPEEVDTVIVGSGIAGTSIAWNLGLAKDAEQAAGQDQDDHTEAGRTEPQTDPARVLMLEARQACSGATGRNGGHTKAASYLSFLRHAETYGTATAVQIARLELDCIRTIHALAASQGIDCDSHPCPTLDVHYDPDGWQRARDAVAAMKKAFPAGDPAAAYTLLTRDEAIQQGCPCSDDQGSGSKTKPICGVVRYEEAGSIWPYKLVVGLLKRLLDQDKLNLQTNTPVTALTKVDGGYEVHTKRGTVRARRVILATNGYTARLVPRLQGVVVPLRGQISMQRPGSNMPGHTTANPRATALQTTYSFIYGSGYYEYLISRPPGSLHAGDIVIGGGLRYADSRPDVVPGLCEYGTTDDTTLNPRVSAYLTGTTPRYFGKDRFWGADHPDGRVRAEWTGIMGFTPDGFPLVGSFDGPPDGAPKDESLSTSSGLWLCCAFQGNGMVCAWMCGRALAEMLQGRDDASLQQWFPSCFRVTEDRLKIPFQGKPGVKQG